MYRQNLDFYKKAFESYNWEIHRSEHYLFYVFPSSLASIEIDQIIKIQEQAFDMIIHYLEVTVPKKKIEYFLYPNKTLKKTLMGNSWYAQSILNEFRIHALYTENDKVIGPHEDTHLLVLPWGQSANFLEEGLAEYMVGHSWRGENLRELSKVGIAMGLNINISKILSKQTWLDTPDEYAQYYYAFAGSFVEFFIETFGKKKFKILYMNTSDLYTNEENGKVFIGVTDKSPVEIDRIWKEWL